MKRVGVVWTRSRRNFLSELGVTGAGVLAAEYVDERSLEGRQFRCLLAHFSTLQGGREACLSFATHG
jgi:hypothetical protein